MKFVVRAALCCVPLLAAGCDRASSGGSAGHDAEAIQTGVAGGPKFLRGDPRLTVAHTGERRLEFTPPTGPALTYRERIATDGQGRFSLEPIGVPADWPAFELVQRVREGYLFRYRDFLVRDRRLFRINWRVIQLDETASVAGRTCLRYRIERTVGQAVTFELAVDPVTGLVLASEERGPGGERVASMVYETLQLDPDPHQPVWHVASNEERVLDPQLSIAEQIQQQPLEPRLLPPGYGPLEAATVTDGNGAQWLKLTYTDGVEPLFVFEGLDSLAHAGTGSSSSSVVVFQVGAATVVQGRVDGFELIVIGKAPQSELLDLIESTLP